MNVARIARGEHVLINAKALELYITRTVSLMLLWGL